MKLKNGKLTFLIGEESTTLELKDSDSGQIFAQVLLNPSQLSAILSRRGNVECEISVFGLEKLGKKMIHKPHTFDITGIDIKRNETDVLAGLANKTIPEGWVSDNYFGSQNSFFEKDGRKFARVTIRSWVDISD